MYSERYIPKIAKVIWMRTWSPSSTRRSHEDNQDACGSSRYRYSPFIDLCWIE